MVVIWRSEGRQKEIGHGRLPRYERAGDHGVVRPPRLVGGTRCRGSWPDVLAAAGGRLMRTFVYNAHPARVIFGSGTLSQLPDEVARLGLERALVLATPQQEAAALELTARLGGRAAGVYAG